MWNQVTELYWVLYKVLGPLALPNESNSELLDELESGWHSYPKELNQHTGNLINSIKTLKQQLCSDHESEAATGIQRSTLDTLRDLEGELRMLSSTLSMVQDDVASVLAQILKPKLVPETGDIAPGFDYAHELNRNDPRHPDCEDESFLGILHEDSYWDFNAYWRFELSVAKLIQEHSFESHPRLYQSVIWTIHHALQMLGSSRTDTDMYEISNLDYETQLEFQNHLSVILRNVCDGNVPKNQDGPFRNPYLSDN